MVGCVKNIPNIPKIVRGGMPVFVFGGKMAKFALECACCNCGRATNKNISMLLSNFLATFGRYCIFLRRVFALPDRWRETFRRTFAEIMKLGVDSIPLVLIISVFIGAVITIQMQLNISSPLIPAYSVGLATRDIVLLEFSNSILCLILAGKVGSNIASEIGTMRVTEQIDALDIMGINSANFLVLPKIAGLVLFMPVLVIFCIATSYIGGYGVAVMTDLIPVSKYLYGLQALFNEWYVWYGLIKSLFFAFIIASTSSFYGYYAHGGALEVGKASTDGVVSSSVFILLFDVVLTKLLLQWLKSKILANRSTGALCSTM